MIYRGESINSGNDRGTKLSADFTNQLCTSQSFCTRTLFRIAESFKQILDKTNHHEKHILPFTKERNLSVPIVNGKY